MTRQFWSRTPLAPPLNALPLSMLIDASADLVNCGNAPKLTNMTQFGYFAWIKVAATPGDNRLWQKGYLGANSTYGYASMNSTGDGVGYFANRATTLLSVNAPVANFAAYGTGKWLFIAAVVDYASDANLRIYMGDTSMSPREPSAYTSQVAGSGAHATDAGAPFVIGNRANGGVVFNGYIAALGVINGHVLSYGEILRVWQGDYLSIAGLGGLWFPGRDGLGKVIDYSGYGNHGTLAGAPTVEQGTHLELSRPQYRPRLFGYEPPTVADLNIAVVPSDPFYQINTIKIVG